MRNPVYTKTKNIDITVMESNGGFNMKRQHYHDAYEIYFMLDGEREIFLYNHNYIAKKGDIFIIKPYSLHSIYSPSPKYYRRYLLNFSPAELENMRNMYDVDELISKISPCLISTNQEQAEMIYNNFKNIDYFMHRHKDINSHSSYSLVKMAVITFMEYLCDLSVKNPTVSFTNTPDFPDYALASTLSYINTHFNENITLDFISNYAHMSKSNFCLVFKQTVGDTFINYLNSLRITYVHKLLQTTDISLTQIAEQTGFASVDYMTRTFKKIHGISPSEMKKNITSKM